ncbi:MAG: ubiquitin-binding protein cue5 [Alectoria sarmentosa]|nr:MAG: ubiquitin-binding protein cue5 [Alectoria sarmentosa]
MSDPEKPKPKAPPESPTTAKANDSDDETTETPLSPLKSTLSTEIPKSGLGEDVPPPKPPRPLAPEQQAENTLKEAFPSIDATVIKAVLHASGGRVEPAFNALLGMSDPDAAEPPPPLQPPRPQRAPAVPTSTEESQLAADERYARQLAEHYNGAPAYVEGPRSGSGNRRPQKREASRRSGYDQDEGPSWFDELPILKDNIKKGFLETQSTVNKWVNSLKKKIDGEDEDEIQGRPPQQGYPAQQQFSGRRSSEFGRRSADRERYDADPQVLGDDFAGLQMRDNEAAQRRSNRPLANPDLFKPTPPRPQPTQSGRRVSFQDGPPEEIDIHYPKSPDPINRPSSGAGGRSSKWQPLAPVDPSPVADHDPFSLGDSDDEEAKKRDFKAEDSERLKRAAAEATSGHVDFTGEKKLEPHETSETLETRDKETENLVGKP